MKELDTPTRAYHYAVGQQLNPMLGACFQNPMPMTTEILDDEIRQVMQFRDQEIARYERYIGNLQELRKDLLG